MIRVASRAVGDDFSLRTVTGGAVRFRRHEHIGSFATLSSAMTNVAVERRLRRRIDLMFRVIEIGLRHPAIDQNRLRDHRRPVRDGFHFVTKSAAGEVTARGRAHSRLRLVRIFGEENRALELVAGMKLVAQLFDLLRDESRNFAFRDSSLHPRVIGVLRGQAAQKRADKIDISVRDPHFRISPIELKRMTGLTIVRESNSLHQVTVGLRLVAVSAIKLLPVHRWNVGSEMTLVIETQNIRVAGVRAFELEFGMAVPKIHERRGVTLRRSRQFKNNLLRRMRMSMKCIARHLHTFLRRRRHCCGIVVASRAL